VKFKIDENLPSEVARLLTSAGHDAETVFDESLVGASDQNLIEICTSEDRALVTLDLDFSNVRAYPPKDHFGLIVLRLRRQDKSHVLNVISQTIDMFEREQIAKRLWIVEEDRLRIRK
jgi:predicted nuclease of predicted toxin-antitoxin system